MSISNFTISYDSSKLSEFILDSNIKLYFKFDNFPLIDEISKQKLFINGGQPIIESGVFGNGLRLRPDLSIQFPLILDNNSEFSIGFWIKPSYLKPAIDSTTGQSINYKLSLFDKSNYEFLSDFNYINPINTSFVFFEESIENNKNIMNFILGEDNGDTVNLYSSPYEAGIFHYFWISYFGLTRTFVVYIDGVISSVFSKDEKTIPLNIFNSSSIPFHINYSAIGDSSLIRGSSSFIDDFIFINKYIIDESIIEKHINNGSDYVINKSTFYRNDDCLSFIFDDPSTMQITSIFSNNKDTFLGTSDGKILLGNKKIWEVQRDFSNQDEVKNMIVYNKDKESSIIIDDNQISLFKSSIRIS